MGISRISPGKRISIKRLSSSLIPTAVGDGRSGWLDGGVPLCDSPPAAYFPWFQEEVLAAINEHSEAPNVS